MEKLNIDEKIAEIDFILNDNTHSNYFENKIMNNFMFSLMIIKL